ncbi:MAG: hypothetical protein PF495_19375 [Spirochaetales bacterium]|jgi:hypothetical protein|nr:hypothetical protein [Spirochaetales bacterium]
MSATQEIVVDPFLLCLPNPCSTGDQLELFIDSLLGWKRLIDHRDARVLLSSSAQVALNDDGEFPHRHRLVALIDHHNFEIADQKTISQLVDGILNRMPSFEDYFGIDDILIDDYLVEPTLMLSRLKENCQQAFAEILSTISLIQQIEPTVHNELMIGSSISNKSTDPIPDEVRVESKIDAVNFCKQGLNQPETFPHTVDNKISISFSHEELLDGLSLLAVWEQDSTEYSALSAIEMCIKNLVDSGVDPGQMADFALGPHFLDSTSKWGGTYIMNTIKSCARIILGIPQYALNEFRVTAKSTSQQRTRADGALAYRTHLTKKGVGIRLMVWKLPNESYEFANIGPKNELEIL